MHSASEVTHKVPRGSKGSSQRGESLQGGLERPSRPGLLRDLRGAQELGCTNFDPRVTSSRAFGTLGVAVPYGDSRGRLGRSSEVSRGASAISGSPDARGPLGAPSPTPVSRSPASARFRPSPVRMSPRAGGRVAANQPSRAQEEGFRPARTRAGKAGDGLGHSPAATPLADPSVSVSVTPPASR